MTPDSRHSPIARRLLVPALMALALPACAPGPSGSGGFTVAPGRMPAFCAGDASRRFGVGLGDIDTGATLRQADGYVVNGSFQLTSGDSVLFACNFDSEGRFAGTTGR